MNAPDSPPGAPSLPPDASAPRVLVVDDHAIIVDAIVAVLRPLRRTAHIECAATLAAALTHLARSPFDAAVVDLTLPDSEGAATIEQLRAAAPTLALVVFTGTTDAQALAACTRAGVSAIVSKADDVAALRGALARLLGAPPPPSGPGAAQAAYPPVTLTPRQREVLQLIRQGLENKEIAQRLTVSPSTVGVLVSQLLVRLGASNRAQAATMAWRVVPPLL